MDVIFEVVGGTPFTMEVSLSDTVFQMKENIEKHKGIPVPHQVLAFRGDVLLDNTCTVESCLIGPSSRVRLYIMDQYQPLPPPPPPPKPRPQPQPQPHQPITANLIVRVPTEYSLDSFVVNIAGSALPLKQKLHQIYGFPTDMLGLYVNRMLELTGDKPLYEYGVSDGSVIEVFVRPPPLASSSSASNDNTTLLASSSSASNNNTTLLASSSSALSNLPPHLPSSSSGSNKLRVQVQTPSKMRMDFDVDPTDKVQMLRDKLEMRQQMLNLQLSPHEYHFEYKKIAMYEKETFLWHDVCQDDEILIANGPVSYASATKMRLKREEILNGTGISRNKTY